MHNIILTKNWLHSPSLFQNRENPDIIWTGEEANLALLLQPSEHNHAVSKNNYEDKGVN